MKRNELVITNNKKYNKFIFNFFAIAITILVAFMIIMIIIDPFYHYHAPIKPLKLVQEKQAYQNLGIARNLTYDSILTGSSMTENFRISQINELFGCDAVKLSFQGGRVPNYELLFNEAFKNENVEIKNIFYGCDISPYIDDPNSEIPNKIPEYLYDGNIFTDIKYVLNKTAMLNYAIPYLKYGLQNNLPNIDDSYMWYQISTFDKSEAIKQYNRPDLQEKKPSNLYEENVKINCEKIGKYIKENPDVNFYVFFPPYSILYYDSFNREGRLEAVINAQEMVAEYFLQFPNVNLSSFLAEKDIICNLDNYKDYTHYSEKINKYMAEEIKAEGKMLNKDNYKKYFEDFRDFLYNYDYDKIFE